MSKPKVFIGVGHGGSDTGAVGRIVEKDVNLQMALACADYLRKFGVDVKLSRTKDENDPIMDEVRECNAFAPDLAIDVHNNAGNGDGFEVYHYSKGGTSKILAQNIENEVKKIGQNSRGLKTRVGDNGKDYYAFIRDVEAPSVICEGVFVDSKDAEIADTLPEQKKFGEVYAKGIITTLRLIGFNISEQNDMSFDEALQEFINRGIIDTPDHWRNSPDEYADDLIIKTAKYLQHLT
jgi:N-acetylmuramoyl-L-alanine amidase